MASLRMHEIFTKGDLDVRPFQHRSVRIVVPNDAVITNEAIAAKNRRQIEGNVAWERNRRNLRTVTQLGLGSIVSTAAEEYLSDFGGDVEGGGEGGRSEERRWGRPKTRILCRT